MALFTHFLNDFNRVTSFHAFNKYLLSSYCEPGTVPSARDARIVTQLLPPGAPEGVGVGVGKSSSSRRSEWAAPTPPDRHLTQSRGPGQLPSERGTLPGLEGQARGPPHIPDTLPRRIPRHIYWVSPRMHAHTLTAGLLNEVEMYFNKYCLIIIPSVCVHIWGTPCTYMSLKRKCYEV